MMQERASGSDLLEDFGDAGWPALRLRGMGGGCSGIALMAKLDS